MSLVEQLNAITERRLDTLTNQVYSEMKGIVGAHKRSGEAYNSIHIEQEGEHSRFVGGTNAHLYWLDQGNGTGGIPKNPPPKAPMPLTYGYKEMKPVGYAMRVKNYEGIHFVEWIANRHR